VARLTRHTSDVAVIGGGVVGLCVGLHLLRSGRTVALLERAQPGSGASGHNGGALSVGDCAPVAMPGAVRSAPRMLTDPLSPFALRWRYLPRASPWLIRFLLASRKSRVEEISKALNSLMVTSTGAYEALLRDTEAASLLHEGGLMYGYASEKPSTETQFGLDLRVRRGCDVRVLDRDEIAELDPNLGRLFGSGIYLPSARFTKEPKRFTRALAAQFLAEGGQLVQAEATGFQQRNGRIDAVETDAGPVPTGSVVIAAGAWSRPLVRRLGFDVPLDSERGYGMTLPQPNISLPFPIISGDHHFGASPDDGGLRIVGTVEFAGLKASPNFDRSDRLERAAQRVFPDVNTAGAKRWMSYRPSMPDSLPVIAQSPNKENAYLAFGHGHKGLCQAAITGKLIRELMDGTETTVDVTPFRPHRFYLGAQRLRAETYAVTRTRSW
jgi:glycine/D-amino acid oxidase-like deaminating enzyme